MFVTLTDALQKDSEKGVNDETETETVNATVFSVLRKLFSDVNLS